MDGESGKTFLIFFILMRNGLIFKIKGIPAQLQVLISQGGNFFNPDDDASALAQKKNQKTFGR
ncbi:MAG: hypothetical protein ACKO4W_12470 [Bacteroidota bacterium]|jgi:hypothetical protein